MRANSELQECKIVLVGNKHDKVTDRAVSTEKGKSIADSYGIKYYEASAKSCYNINEIFKDLAEGIYNQSLQFSLQKQQKIMFYKRTKMNRIPPSPIFFIYSFINITLNCTYLELFAENRSKTKRPTRIEIQNDNFQKGSPSSRRSRGENDSSNK